MTIQSSKDERGIQSFATTWKPRRTVIRKLKIVPVLVAGTNRAKLELEPSILLWTGGLRELSLSYTVSGSRS